MNRSVCFSLASALLFTLPFLRAADSIPLAVSSDILAGPGGSAQEPTAAPLPSADLEHASRTIPPPVYRPYTVAQKFKAATQDVFWPYALAGVGFSAGFSQLTNTPSEWGQGAEGYARRYANAFGVNLSYQYFSATLESALHEDPRYFPSGDRSTRARFHHAVAGVFLTRKDDGGSGFAYARWASAYGAGFLSNTWNPRSNNHASDALITGTTILGIDLAVKLGQEFVPFLRHLKP